MSSESFKPKPEKIEKIQTGNEKLDKNPGENDVSNTEGEENYTTEKNEEERQTELEAVRHELHMDEELEIQDTEENTIEAWEPNEDGIDEADRVTDRDYYPFEKQFLREKRLKRIAAENYNEYDEPLKETRETLSNLESVISDVKSGVYVVPEKEIPLQKAQEKLIPYFERKRNEYEIKRELKERNRKNKYSETSEHYPQKQEEEDYEINKKEMHPVGVELLKWNYDKRPLSLIPTDDLIRYENTDRSNIREVLNFAIDTELERRQKNNPVTEFVKNIGRYGTEFFKKPLQTEAEKKNEEIRKIERKKHEAEVKKYNKELFWQEYKDIGNLSRMSKERLNEEEKEANNQAGQFISPAVHYIGKERQEKVRGEKKRRGLK